MFLFINSSFAYNTRRSTRQRVDEKPERCLGTAVVHFRRTRTHRMPARSRAANKAKVPEDIEGSHISNTGRRVCLSCRKEFPALDINTFKSHVCGRPRRQVFLEMRRQRLLDGARHGDIAHRIQAGTDITAVVRPNREEMVAVLEGGALTGSVTLTHRSEHMFSFSPDSTADRAIGVAAGSSAANGQRAPTSRGVLPESLKQKLGLKLLAASTLELQKQLLGELLFTQISPAQPVFAGTSLPENPTQPTPCPMPSHAIPQSPTYTPALVICCTLGPSIGHPEPLMCSANSIR